MTKKELNNKIIEIAQEIIKTREHLNITSKYLKTLNKSLKFYVDMKKQK